MHRYTDAAGARRGISRASAQRLAEIIGAPDAGRPGAGEKEVLVVDAGRSRRVPPGEVLLEGGGRFEVTGRLPRDLPLGYHELNGEDGRTRRLICAPERCHLPAGRRAWGIGAQLYAARSEESWGIGDLADLRRLGSWATAAGAGFVLLNPLGAVAPVGPQQPSPYFPASRRFSNPLYLSVADVPGAERVPDVVSQAARAGRALNSGEEIDRDACWHIKQRALEAIWAAQPPRDDFSDWRMRQGEPLTRFALWCVLAERHGARWRDWPTDFRAPNGAGVRRIARTDARRVEFHAWLQWCCARQLGAATTGIGLIHDLPIGVDPDGYDAWDWQDVLALDASVGAPPDAFNRRGQDWGLPPFVPWRLQRAGYEPFIATIRAALRHGIGLRIDHVMGLFRLWWIPAGSAPGDGAYVRYPARDLLRIVALESQRAGAIIVGEDLGTVEESARQLLAASDILSYRLLWFESEPPARWPRTAMAAVTTHDLPTVAGLWDGSDLAEQRAVGIDPNEEGTAEIVTRLAARAHVDRGAPVSDAVAGAYALLAEAPAVLLCATLEDAVGATKRPNIPGTDAERPNWSLALPVSLEDLEENPLARRVARILGDAVAAPAVRGRSGGAHDTAKEPCSDA